MTEHQILDERIYTILTKPMDIQTMAKKLGVSTFDVRTSLMNLVGEKRAGRACTNSFKDMYERKV